MVHVQVRTILHDLPLLLLLLAGLSIPLLLLPSPFTSIARALSTTLASLGWIICLVAFLLFSITLLLLGEKLLIRWQKVDDARVGAFEHRQGREARMEERVATGFRGPLHKANKESRKFLGGLWGRPKAAVVVRPSQSVRVEEVELKEIKPEVASEMRRRRVPPPPEAPALPPR